MSIAEELGNLVERSYQCTLRPVRELCSKRDYDEVEMLLQKRTRAFIESIRTSSNNRFSGGGSGAADDDDLSDTPTLEDAAFDMSPPADNEYLPPPARKLPAISRSFFSRFHRKANPGSDLASSFQLQKTASSLSFRSLTLGSHRRVYLSDWLDSHQFIEWLIEFLFMLWYSCVPPAYPRESPDLDADTVSYIAIRQVCKQIVWSSRVRIGDSRHNHMAKCYKAAFKFLPWGARLLLGEQGPKGESRWSDVAYDPFQRNVGSSQKFHNSRLLHWLTLEFDNPYMEKSYQVDWAGHLMKTPYWPFFATIMLAVAYVTVVYGSLKNDYASLTFVRLLITEPVSWLLMAAIIQLVAVTVLFNHSQRFKENYFFYQFVLGLCICCTAAVWMYEVRNLFVFIAWPISEGFTMAFILIAVSCLFYIRFVYLLWLTVLTAVFTASMRVAICSEAHACTVESSLPLQQILAIVGSLLLVFSGRYLFESHSRLDFFMYRNLYRESERSERLLLNILPSQVIQHLKSNGQDNEFGKEPPRAHAIPIGIAQAYDKVTVLFTDVVSFTTFSSHISPEELVLFLNDLFTAFDNMAEESGLEKIKTIGDAYLCISGLPKPDPIHAVAAGKMGLKISALMKTGVFRDHNNLPLGCRIGIHSGSVVAGVIGRKKFIYDIWGDAVNTASRMESTGETNRVHCSEDTANLIREQAHPGDFTLSCRGEILVKGKGIMKTYWVEDGTGDISPARALVGSQSPVITPITEERHSQIDSHR